MIKSTDYSNGVMAITNLAREINPQIGNYQEHFFIENFGFIVRLSNGGIKIPSEVAKDYEVNPHTVTRAIVKEVAESYWTT
jgi:hypothetical protein